MQRVGNDRSVPIALILTATAAALVVPGCDRAETARAPVVRPVKTMVVVPAAANRERAFAGRVVAAREVDLAFQVPGVLSHLPAKEGARVAKGDVVASLRTDEFQARLSVLQGQLEQSRAGLRALRAGDRPEERLRLEARARAAEARLAHAKAEFDRFSELIRENAVARNLYELSETDYRVAQEELRVAQEAVRMSGQGRQEDIEAREAEVRALESRVREATIQLDDAVLRVPFDGVIGRRFVEENQNIAVGAPVVRLQDTAEVTVSIDVPEGVMAAGIRPDEIERLEAEFAAVPGRRFPVTVREVAQVADAATQTFNVRATMSAPEGLSLLPGMTATVRMTYRERSGGRPGFAVPVGAVAEDGSGDPSVWLISSDQAAHRRSVRLGDATGAQVWVLEGLKPGDRIAVSGATMLREGARVRDLGDGLGAARP